MKKIKELEETATTMAVNYGPMDFEDFMDEMSKISTLEWEDMETCEYLYDVFSSELDKICKKEQDDLFLHYHLGE